MTCRLRFSETIFTLENTINKYLNIYKHSETVNEEWLFVKITVLSYQMGKIEYNLLNHDKSIKAGLTTINKVQIKHISWVLLEIVLLI